MKKIDSIVQISETEKNCHLIEFQNGSSLYLVGTAHASSSSVELVEKVVREVNPDKLLIELDQSRYDLISQGGKRSIEQKDIVSIIKEKKVLFFITYLFISSLQKNLAQKIGAKLGGEFEKAHQLSKELDIQLVLIDRDANITLKRIIHSMSFFEQIQFLFHFFLLDGYNDKSKDAEEEIEKLKEEENLLKVIEDMGEKYPIVKRVLIDERDQYMVSEILSSSWKKGVAVVGAGHTPGMLKQLGEEKDIKDTQELKTIPKGTVMWKVLGFSFPIFIILLMSYSFVYKGEEIFKETVGAWILINGVLSALGALIAFGHPVTVLVSFIFAPLTSLTPVVGVGLVAALSQLYFSKPKVEEFKNFYVDIQKISHWWKNRVVRILLVFILSSLGSALGTFIGTSYLLKIIQ